MHFFRKLITHRKLAALLTIGMLLRSIVAVGYMLDTSPADGGLLSIKLCDGPAGINAIAGLEDHSQHHGHHDQNEEHEHASQDHAFSSCGFWSASSQLLLADTIVFENQIRFHSDEIIHYQNNLTIQFLVNARYARAPPSLS